MHESMTRAKSVLAINVGSSSVKASVVVVPSNDGVEPEHFASCVAERLGTFEAVLHYSKPGSESSENDDNSIKIPGCSHEHAVEKILDKLLAQKEYEIVAIGHRVVHGGSEFTDSVRISESTLEKIDKLSSLAPLHNPHNVAGIRACRNKLPERIPQFAVFDTSFHHTIPPHAATLPLPKEYREMGIKKYGFHGTSVKYVVEKASEKLTELLRHYKDVDENKKDSCRELQSFNMIVCHLGSGASVTAVSDGKSLDTSMGFTPASGLMMGTRSGTVDPSVVVFALQDEHSSNNKSIVDILLDLNKKSGLKAMTGHSDMRKVLAGANDCKNGAQDDENEYDLAVDMFVYRLIQHIAMMAVALPGELDALVFTAGIGEFSPLIRQKCIEQLKRTIFPQLQLDAQRNQSNEVVLSPDGQRPVVLDISTDEEIMIARDCLRLLNTRT